jgi:AcrR family transcriptional regulator
LTGGRRHPVERESTRERLVEAAMRLFTYQGYARTGLSEIAREASALPGSLYHFFPTKEDLLAAVLEARKKMMWPELLQPIWDRIDDPIERVFGLLDGYRQMLHVTDFEHGCPIGNLAIEVTESNPKIRHLIAENFDGWIAAVETCFREAKDRLPEEIDPKHLAVFVLTTMEGAVMLARTYRDYSAYDAAVASLRDYIDRLVATETEWHS